MSIIFQACDEIELFLVYFERVLKKMKGFDALAINSINLRLILMLDDVAILLLTNWDLGFEVL